MDPWGGILRAREGNPRPDTPDQMATEREEWSESWTTWQMAARADSRGQWEDSGCRRCPSVCKERLELPSAVMVAKMPPHTNKPNGRIRMRARTHTQTRVCRFVGACVFLKNVERETRDCEKETREVYSPNI